jgi:hypothetical protein
LWQKHISKWQGSSQSQVAYCRYNELDPNKFSYHKRKQLAQLLPVKPSGFINLPLPQALPVEVSPSLTLHLTNGMTTHRYSS